MRDILYLYWNEDSNAQNARFKIKVKIQVIYEFPRQKRISIQNLNMTRQIARICIVLENTHTLAYTSILEFVYFYIYIDSYLDLSSRLGPSETMYSGVIITGRLE